MRASAQHAFDRGRDLEGLFELLRVAATSLCQRVAATSTAPHRRCRAHYFAGLHATAWPRRRATWCARRRRWRAAAAAAATRWLRPGGAIPEKLPEALATARAEIEKALG